MLLCKYMRTGIEVASDVELRIPFGENISLMLTLRDPFIDPLPDSHHTIFGFEDAIYNGIPVIKGRDFFYYMLRPRLVSIGSPDNIKSAFLTVFGSDPDMPMVALNTFVSSISPAEQNAFWDDISFVLGDISSFQTFLASLKDFQGFTFNNRQMIKQLLNHW